MLPYTTYMTNKEKNEKLTPVQKKFAKEYIIDFNGTEAYMRASTSNNRKSAAVQASKLLKMPKVDEFIKAYAQEQLGPLEKDLLGNVKFWIEIRDAVNEHVGPTVSLKEILGLVEEYGDDELIEEFTKAIKELRSYYLPDARVTDRIKASEMLAKYRSMFVEHKTVDVTAAVTIIDNIPKDKE